MWLQKLTAKRDTTSITAGDEQYLSEFWQHIAQEIIQKTRTCSTKLMVR